MSYLNELGIHDYGDALEMLSRTTGALKGFSALLDAALAQGGGDLQPASFGIVELLDRQIEDIEELGTFLRGEFSRVRADKLQIRDGVTIARLTGLPVRKVEVVIQVAAGIDLSTKRERDPLEAETAKKEALDYLVARALASDRWLELASAFADIPTDALRLALEALLYLDDGALGSMSQSEYMAELTSRIRPAAADHSEQFVEAVKQVHEETMEASAVKAKEMRNAFIREQVSEGADLAAIAQALNLKKATVERVVGQLLAGATPQSDDDRVPGSKAVNQ